MRRADVAKVKVEQVTTMAEGAPWGSVHTAKDGPAIQSAIRNVARAERGRGGWGVIEASTDPEGRRVVEFHQAHPHNRTRYTFTMAGAEG